MSFFGWNSKSLYKPPPELIALRGSIDAQLRENFPNLEQYQDIAKEAESVFRELNAVIRGKEHAEEATRLREDLKARLSRLAAKINKNRRDTGGGSEQLDVEEINALRKKRLRDDAKSRMMDLREQVESLKKCCLGEEVPQGKTLDSMTMDLVKTIAALNDGFFKEHRGDREIDGLKREILNLAGWLSEFVDQNKQAISSKGLESKAAMVVMKITIAVNTISS